MFDFAWSELMVIALVALVVIGPKDLPRVLRTLGKWMSRARMIAREFQGSIDQMIRESELDEVRREVQKVAEIDLDHQIKSSVDPAGEMQKTLDTLPATSAEPATQEPPAVAAVPELPPATASGPAIEAPAPAAESEHDRSKTPTPA